MTRRWRILTKASVFTALLLLVLALPWLLLGLRGHVYWTHNLIFIAIMILATASMRAINRTGEVSLGTAGFMLVGGYGAALLAQKLGLSPWLTMFLGALVAALVGLAVAYPFFRIKGVYFAIATLLLGFVFLYLAGWRADLTGGWEGMRFYKILPQITIGSHTLVFDSKTNIPYYYLTIVIVGICLFILYRMEHSRIGLVWKSIRESDNLAQSIGVNIMAQKVFVFTVACFFTGLAGGLFAFHVHALSPTSTPANVFHFFTSIYCLMYMVVGGTESFYGPLIGVTLFLLLREWARPLQAYWPLVIGALLILFVFFMPRGLIALPDYLTEWYRKLRRLFRGKVASPTEQ